MSFLFKILQAVQRSYFIAPFARRPLLRAMGMELGSRTRVKGGVTFFSGNITLGDRCFVNSGCFFDASARITLETDVDLGPRVMLITGTHAIGPPHSRAAANTAAPITIEAGSWIGAGTIIQPGVTVASGCIVAAGAVVTRSTEPNGFYGGTPALRIKDLA